MSMQSPVEASVLDDAAGQPVARRRLLWAAMTMSDAGDADAALSAFGIVVTVAILPMPYGRRFRCRRRLVVALVGHGRVSMKPRVVSRLPFCRVRKTA